jgi:hypothetical protein
MVVRVAVAEGPVAAERRAGGGGLGEPLLRVAQLRYGLG